MMLQLNLSNVISIINLLYHITNISKFKGHLKKLAVNFSFVNRNDNKGKKLISSYYIQSPVFYIIICELS